MNNDAVLTIKKNMIAIGRLLWEKELATGLNGNISVRVDDDHLLLTASKTCLGLLHENDILLMKVDGQVLDPGVISSEKMMHAEIYRNFPHIKAVLHTHSTITNAYFLEHDQFSPRVFESRLYLGNVKAIPQATPSVTEIKPVMDGLTDNNVVVLKHHGVLAAGEDLFDCFLLIQSLEEAVKIEAFSRLFRVEAPAKAKRGRKPAAVADPDSPAAQALPMFSPEHMQAIVALVNKDRQVKELGEKTGMTMELGIKLDESGRVYSFRFERGRIAQVGANAEAEFLISAPEKVWRAVFTRQIDPFVATTQKKMHLRGDFARISKWYAPCSRIFELWAEVPVA